MQKKAGLIIGAIVIAIVLAVFFLMQSMKSSDPKSESSQATGSTAASKGSIASLLASGKSVSCSMAYPDGGGSGSIAVSGKKMRGDFTVLVGGKDSKTSMISDGEFMYMWSDADKKGTKFKVPDASASTTASSTQAQNFDMNEEVDLKCTGEGVDASKFVVPTDVEFTDMSAMMEQMQGQPGAAGGSPKSPCDAITDPEAKASCLSAFSNSQ